MILALVKQVIKTTLLMQYLTQVVPRENFRIV